MPTTKPKSPPCSFASHAQAIEAERLRAEHLAERARREAAAQAARAKKRAATEARKAKRRADAEVKRIAEAEQRVKEAEATAEKIAKKSLALGKLATQAVETTLLLQEFPDLAKLYLEEYRGMVKADGRVPPNGAALKAATQSMLDQVAERFDELESSDLCDIDESDREGLDQWQPTRAEFEFVKLYFFRELFAARPKPKAPTATAPGSPDRIAAMAERQEAGEDLYHGEDATAEDRKLKTKNRSNGGRPDEADAIQILGWADVPEGDQS